MSRWLVTWQESVGDRPVLLCLAQAGAGCGQYRPWQTAFGDEISVVGVQLPGRENRFVEPPAESVAEVVDAVSAELLAALPPDQPYAIFGNSFGGLLGYEITRRLGDRGRWPVALVVAACRPPDRWSGAGRGLVEDEGELRKLLDQRGLDAYDELDEDSLELALMTLRMDAALSLSYRHEGQPHVPCRLEAWSGDRDETVRPHEVDGWRKYAGGRFARRQFAGGHYFCLERGEAVLPALRDLVTRPDLVTRSDTVTRSLERSRQ